MIINEELLLNEYIEKFKIDELFGCSMRKYMTLHTWKSGEFICKEGEKLEYFFFITEGKAKVYKNFENGKSLLICFYDPLKIIGDMEFTRTDIADCSVQAIKDTYAVGMKFSDVSEILLNDSKFLRNICIYLGQKLSSNSTNSAINLLYPLENRLASYILAFLNYDLNNESNHKSRIEFEFEGNYNEIAELLGTSYRHLSRTLNKMCFEGILQKQGKIYIINNINKLQELSGDLYK